MHRFSSRFREGRRSRPATYRLLVERLEDRLPPGDAVTAGLLAGSLIPAGRPAGLALADARLAPQGPASASILAWRVARPGPFDLAGAFTLPAEPTPTATTRDRLQLFSAAEEPFSPAPAPRPQPRTLPADAVPRPVELVAAAPAPAGSASASANVFVALPPSSYQLDQAAAAVVAPALESDDLPSTGLDTGAGVQSSGVRALFGLGHPTAGPFPSKVFTVPDRTHNTGRRVNLPLPDCAVYVSDCEELALINELDGFNLQPRLSVPFSGPIDVNSVTSANVFLVSLGSTIPGQGWMPRGTVVGINQVIWDVETYTLHAESDETLAQHTRFALIVTNGIRDTEGDSVDASAEFRRFRQTAPQPYKRELLDAIRETRRLGVRERDIVTASVFTTQSATAVMEKIRDQIHAQAPEPADFLLGPKGERTVFPFAEVASITYNQQTQVSPPAFTPTNYSVAQLQVIPGAVGQIAFGKYLSPDYLTAARAIPAIGTRTGVPAMHGMNEVSFDLYLPSGQMPPGGWPVVIYGSSSVRSQATNIGAVMAAHGLATITIDVPGYGHGPLSTLTVRPKSGDPVTFRAGGRGLDLDGDNVIGADEGIFATPPFVIIGYRDTVRQMAADLMQLVRVIQVGMDVDGDGVRDLDPARIYSHARSLGTRYDMILLAVEPAVRMGEPTVAGGPDSGMCLCNVNNRHTFGDRLRDRVPSLLNAPGITQIDGVTFMAPYFNENMPLRDGVTLSTRLEDGSVQEIRSPVVNTVAGAMALQQYLENREWVRNSMDSLAYVPHLRRSPLPGVPAKPILFSFAQGDRQTVNPSNTALLRAGQLADRTTYYRHDLVVAEDPSVTRNPHGFMTFINNQNPLVRAIARGAQEQMAVFFASDGKTVIEPPGVEGFFEVPIRGPLPEGLNFIP